jgi:hypothetical protein
VTLAFTQCYTLIEGEVSQARIFSNVSSLSIPVIGF